MKTYTACKELNFAIQLHIDIRKCLYVYAITLILPTFFVLKISAYHFCFIYSYALQIIFYHGSKHYEPSSDCSLGSSLVWAHSVCNIVYQSTQADERSDKSCTNEGLRVKNRLYHMCWPLFLLVNYMIFSF